jgi:epoxide hydrolase 4
MTIAATGPFSGNAARWLDGAQSRYADVAAVRLHYVTKGTGPLVLLLHGFPECWYSWRHQIAALSNRYCVVAPDLRGYNDSEKPPHVRDYRLERLAVDVVALIRHFGADQAALVGHDWGAAIAWSVAQQAPQVVRKLAAFQVPPLALWRANLTLRQILRSWYMLAFQLPWLPERVLRWRKHLLLERLLRRTAVNAETFTDQDLAVYQQAWSQEGALTAMINYYRANVFQLSRIPRHDPPDSPIAAPTLFVYGEQDFAILPATVRHIERVVSGPYRELRIPDAGHWVHRDAPAQVNTALRELLEEG